MLASVAKMLGTSAAYYVGTDINADAVRASVLTMQHNGVACFDIVETDLVSAISPRVLGSVDVLLFNPPYVPTPDDEVGGHGISAAWAGGANGRVVIDRVLPLVSVHSDHELL